DGDMRVLISGAGIAGPALALWLQRAGADVTVVERAPEPRPGGHAVDVRGVARGVIEKMGLREAIRAKQIDDRGFAMVDARDRRPELPLARPLRPALPRGAGTGADRAVRRRRLAGAVAAGRAARGAGPLLRRGQPGARGEVGARPGGAARRRRLLRIAAGRH